MDPVDDAARRPAARLPVWRAERPRRSNVAPSGMMSGMVSDRLLLPPFLNAVLHWWFWESFWPTLVGVALGLPAARWLYNINSRSDARRSKEVDRRQRDEIIDVLIETLHSHARLLRRASSRADDAFETLPEVELAVWGAVRDDAFRLLPDPRLRGRLASHFETADRLTRAHEYRTQRILSRLGTGQWGDPKPTESAVHETLSSHARRSADEAEALIEELLASA